MPTTVQCDLTMPVDIAITPQSPHVFAYRMWRKLPGGNWDQVAQGQTEDDVPDVVHLEGLVAGASVAWWFGVAGQKNTVYRAIVVFSQHGAALPGGTIEISGVTSDNGGAVVQGELVIS